VQREKTPLKPGDAALTQKKFQKRKRAERKKEPSEKTGKGRGEKIYGDDGIEWS